MMLRIRTCSLAQPVLPGTAERLQVANLERGRKRALLRFNLSFRNLRGLAEESG
jgi:hypothetical protein